MSEEEPPATESYLAPEDPGSSAVRRRPSASVRFATEDSNNNSSGDVTQPPVDPAESERPSSTSATGKPSLKVTSDREKLKRISAGAASMASTFLGDKTKSPNYYHIHGRGMPVDFIVEQLSRKAHVHEMYLDLILFIPFLIVFILFSTTGRSVQSDFFTVNALRQNYVDAFWPTTGLNLGIFVQQVAQNQPLNIMTDHTYLDVGNQDDWFQWMNDNLLGYTFDCDFPNATHAELAPQGQNYHIGALRLRTQRVRNDSCAFNTYIVNQSHQILWTGVDTPATTLLCYGAYSAANEQTGEWCGHSYVSSSDAFGQSIVAVEGIYHPGGYVVDIPFNMSCNEAQNYVTATNIYDEVHNCPLVDNFATRVIVAEYFVYAAQYDTFHSVKLFTEVTHGGNWFPQFKFQSFQLRTTNDVTQTGFEITLLVFVAFYIYRYFADLWSAYIRHRLTSHVMEPWHLLEFSNLACFVVMFVFRFQWWVASANAHFTYPAPYAYPIELEDVMMYYQLQIYLNAVNTVLTFLKVLKYLRYDNRMSVLTRTVAECESSILGILILFVVVVVGYSITAMTLFGANIFRFRKINVGISSLMRMLIGDFDYDEMHNVNRYLAGFFFWTYTIIGLFLLLNFIIAVLSDTFARVSGKAHAESMDQVIVKESEEWKLIFTWDNLRHMGRLFLRGRTPRSMMVMMIDDIETIAQAKKKEKEGISDGDPNVSASSLMVEQAIPVMYPSDVDTWIRDEVRDNLGPKYMSMLWMSLHHEYEEAKKSCHEVERKAVSVTVREAVAKVFEDEIMKIDRFDRALTELEHNVSILLEKFNNEKKI